MGPVIARANQSARLDLQGVLFANTNITGINPDHAGGAPDIPLLINTSKPQRRACVNRRATLEG